jgi:hypothetical protein
MNELTIAPPSVIGALARSEIDGQIATARAHPRDVGRYHEQATQLATLNAEVADDCLYALTIDNKVIEGPSVRFAEILASTWGNCRAGARIIEEAHEYVVAQATFHDLETNAMTTFETRRRIIDKKGRRYPAHMVITTCNAACAIALRQAVLRGIPKPFWQDVYEAAKRKAVGDIAQLAEQRQRAIKAFAEYKIDEARILKTLEVASVEAIGADQIAKLRGLYRAIAEGELSPDAAFPPPAPEKKEGKTSTGSASTGSASTIEEFAVMPDPRPKDPPMSTQPQPPDVASAAEAYELGRQAHRKKASRLQWPGRWRDQANIEAWMSGWDAAEEESKQT